MCFRKVLERKIRGEVSGVLLIETGRLVIMVSIVEAQLVSYLTLPSFGFLTDCNSFENLVIVLMFATSANQHLISSYFIIVSRISCRSLKITSSLAC